MHWLDRTVEKRAEADLVLAGARSVIVLGINYWTATGAALAAIRPGVGPSGCEHRPIPAGRVNALYEDYHDTVKPALSAAGRILQRIAGWGGKLKQERC